MKTKMFGQKLMTLLLLMCVMSSMAVAIEIQHQVTGTVTDAQGEPLPGVNIQIKGTTMGTITDMDGKYSIYAAPSSILVFSYVDKQTQKVKVGSQKVINDIMQDNRKSLVVIYNRYLIYGPNYLVAILEDKSMNNKTLC